MATVLQVGADLYGLRESILKFAGYSVCSCPDPGSLDSVLGSAAQVDAALISDDDRRTVSPEVIAEKIRTIFPSAVTILLPQPGRNYDPQRFDKVFEPGDAAPVWLTALRDLLSASQGTLQCTSETIANTRSLRQHARELRAHSASLRKGVGQLRNALASGKKRKPSDDK